MSHYGTTVCAASLAELRSDAHIVAGLFNEARDSQLETVTFGYTQNKMIIQLEEIFSECSSDGWDGYGAAPVTQETYANARFLISCIPFYLLSPEILSPEIGAEPDGHLTFEWYRNPRCLISVSISPEGDLHYASLIGASRYFGTEPFLGEIPLIIRDIINRVVKA